MKSLFLTAVFSLYFGMVFCQQNSSSKNITVFANSGFVLNSGGGFYPGYGGGLQVEFEKNNSAFFIESSYQYFKARNDLFNQLGRGWLLVKSGYNIYPGKLFYVNLGAGGVLETGNKGIEGYGAVLGVGLGIRPKVGNGRLDLFSKINFLVGAVGASSFVVTGVGYVIPLSKSKG